MAFWKANWKIILYTLVGNAMLAFAVCAFVVPQGFMLGGTSGIALTLQNILPVRLSVLTGAVGISLFALGWKFLGWGFAAKSLLSTLMYPVIMAVFEILPIGGLFAGEDRLICALFCAVLIGMGIGLVVRIGGSTGGMDIPPCILQKYKGIPVGQSLMVFDGIIILAQVAFRGLDGILYSLLILFLTSAVIDYTVVTGEQKVELIIISPEYQRIRQMILSQLDCGVTMLQVETGYLRQSQQAVLSIVYAKKYPQIRDAALRIDPKAFIVAAEVKHVHGVGYTLDRSVQQE